MEQLKAFKRRVYDIAKNNHDTFRIEVQFDDAEEFLIRVFETNDRHTFVEGVGTTIEAAIESAERNIPDALDNWSYQE